MKRPIVSTPPDSGGRSTGRRCAPNVRQTLFRRTVLPLVFCIAAPPSLAAPREIPASAAMALYQKGDYRQAARRGLHDLLSQPWNHALRLVVADSLVRIGRPGEATIQLEALDGTAYAETARARLDALRAGTSTSTGPRAMAQAGAPEGQPMLLEAVPQPVAPEPASGSLALAAAPQPMLLEVVPAGPSAPSAPSDKPALRTPSPAQATAPLLAGDDGTGSRSAAARRVAALNEAQDYQATGSAGLALLATEAADEELRLIIANSLAWTGRLGDASTVYAGLIPGSRAREASLGLANARRWSGRDDLAVPLYRDVLAADPADSGARDGLKLAMSELRPRTTVSFGTSIDSGEERRKLATVTHRWRDASGAGIIELETSAVRDSLPLRNASQEELTLRYQAQGVALKPSLELSLPDKGARTVYGSVRLKISDTLSVVEIGRVNWGRIATNPVSLDAHLSATHLGLEANQGFAFGTVVGRFDYYNLSDGNVIRSGSVRLASSWRPLGPNLKPFVGIEMRTAKFNTPNYWSPAQGFGSFFAGLLAEWSGDDWNFYASGQGGLRVHGEAGTSWSLSAGGKRRLSDDFAIGANLWRLASQRDNAAYRSNSAGVFLEKRW